VNLKMITGLLLFVIAIACVIFPVNAALNPHNLWADSNQTSVGKTILNVGITSDIGMKDKNVNSAKFISQRKAELNKVRKVVVQIQGFQSRIFIKPNKGWASGKYYSQFFIKRFTVKGDLNHKDYTIKIYNKNNKLIKTTQGQLHMHGSDYVH